MKNFKEILANPKMKYGGYASVITFVVIVGILVLNLLVQELGWQLDMTERGVYTLGQQSRAILKELDEDVTIYVLASRNETDPKIMEALDRYDQLSSRVSIEVVDAETNPGFVAEYDPEGEGLRNGSVVVATADNFRTIRGLDLYSIDDRNPQAPQILGLNVERRITNALIFVATGRTPIIYQTTNRNEPSLQQVGELAPNLATENFEIRDINLLQAPQIPEDAAILVMFSPRSDLSEGEAQKVKDFLANGGRALFLFDLVGQNYPVFNELLAAYGVTVRNGVVIEGDTDMSTGNPVQLVPGLISHPITDPLIEARSPVLFQAARSIELLPTKPSSVEVKPLLQTSDEAFLRVNLARSETTQIEGDLPGPFFLAVSALEREFTTGDEISRIVVVGNAGSMAGVYPYGPIAGNRDFFLNAVGWLQNQDESLSIRPKTTLQFPMQLSGTQILIFSGLFVVLIPLAILITGLVIWLRRRHL